MSKTAQPDDPSLGRASLFLASGTVVSRILGFISAIILARTIGIVGAGADSFALANQLPNNIYAIIAGGVLSAVLVPHIVKAGLGADGGQSFINKIVTLGFVIFLAVAILATLLAPALVALYAQEGSGQGLGFSSQEMALATAFAYWCLPQILFYALYSLFSEVLNARKVFGPFTWAPALNNIVSMTGLVAFQIVFPAAETSRATDWSPGMIGLLAGSATAGVISQALILLVFWRKAGLSLRPDFQWRGVGLGNTGRAVSWMFGMIVVAQIAGIVQSNVASLAAGEGAPSLAILRFSWLIFMLPHSVVAVSLATAYFTKMATHFRDGDLASLKHDVHSSIKRISLFMVLASVGLIVVALPFARQFTTSPDEAMAMAFVIGLYALGLVPFSALFLVQRAFYAMEDTRTPFFLQVFHALLFISFALVSSTLPVSFIAAGLALSASVATTLQTLAAFVVLKNRLGSYPLGDLGRTLASFVLAAGLASAVGVGLLYVLGGTSADGLILSSAVLAGVSMLIITLGMSATYILVLSVVRNADMKAVLGPIAQRLRHRKD